MKSSLFYILITLLISLFSYHSWFGLGYNVHGDWWFMYSDSLAEYRLPYLWEPAANLGSLGSVLFRLPIEGISSILAAVFNLNSTGIDRLLFFWPQIFLLPFASYLLFNHLIKNRIAATASAFIVAFNTYFLAITTQGHNLITVAFAFYIFGLFIFLKALEERRLTLFLYSSLLFSLSGFIDLRVLYIGAFVTTGLTLSHLYRSGFEIKKIKFLSLTGIGIVGLNLIWLIPVIFGGIGFGDGILSRPLFGDQYWSLQHALTLMHPFWTGGEISWFVQQSIPWFFWLIPISAILGLLIAKNKPFTATFAVIGLAGLFLTKQADVPLSWFYPWAYENVPGFSAFREASKFYIFIILSYAFFIGHLIKWSLANIKNNFWRYSPSVIICFLFFYNTIPLITGSIGTMFVGKELENDYVVLKKQLLNEGGYYRTYWSPITSRWIFHSSTHPAGSILTLSSNEKLFSDTESMQAFNRIKSFLELNYSNDLLDSLSVKYVGVPTSGQINDEDLFKDYGRSADPQIRDKYIGLFESSEFLTRTDIGNTDLTIFENKDYLPYIRSMSHLTSYENSFDLVNKYAFAVNRLEKDFSFTLKEENHVAIPTTHISQPFENVDTKNIQGCIITYPTTINQDKLQLYINESTSQVSYRMSGSELIFRSKYNPDLIHSNQTIDDLGYDIILTAIPIEALNTAIAKIGSRVVLLNPSDEWQSLGVVKQPITVYEVSGTNAVSNGSFENGLWQEKVGDCNNFDESPVIDMSRSSESIEGDNSLQLSATRHIACTNTSVSELEPGQEYLFSFNYQGDAEQAGFYLSFNSGTTSVISERLPITNTDWQEYQRIITVPVEITNPRLHLYAYQTNEKTNNVVRYDNVQIRSIEAVETINPVQEDSFIATPLSLASGTTTFTFKSDKPLVNLIRNGDLEKGLWRDEVGDCNNYDDLPLLGMRSVSNSSNDTNALELEATRHTACTGPAPVPVIEGKSYLLSFDYQSNETTNAGFNLAWNGTTTPAINERISITNSGWQTFSKRVTAPAGVTSASLLLYAYEEDGTSPVRVRYDNVSLVELPDVFNRYYLVEDDGTNFVEPRETNFELINPTKKRVTIKGATTPFYLAMSESYHPQWQAQFYNNKVRGFFQSWVPFVQPDRVPDEHHFELNGFLNGWYIDTTVYCEQDNLCTKNPDGSYDMELVLEFFPQRWFYLGLLISGTTLVGIIGYLLYDVVRRRKKALANKNQSL